MLVIVISGLILIYFSALAFKNTFNFSTRVTKWLRIAQLTLLLLLIVLFTLQRYNIYLRGYYAPKIIFWGWLFVAMLLYAFGNKNHIHGFEKRIYQILFFLPLASPLIVLVPFAGAALMLRFHESFIGSNSMLVYSSNNIRIEQAYIRFMSPDPPLEIYSKHNLFSYKDTVIDIMFSEKLDSLKVQEFSPDSFKIVYFNNSDSLNGGTVQEFSIRVKK